MTELDNGAAYYADADIPWPERAAAHLMLTAPAMRKKLAGCVAEDGEILWEELAEHPGGWSSHEMDLLMIAQSLASGLPISLRARLSPGLDDASVRAVVEAVRVACTGRATLD